MKIDDLGMFDKFHLYMVDEVESTNDYLKLNYESFPDNSILWALRQTNGRGRFDRTWVSSNDITFSFLFKKPQNNAILAPVAIVDALEEYDIKTDIKWPNDVYLKGKKLSGILIEDIYLDKYQASIVGIGINHYDKPEVGGIGLNDSDIDSEDLIVRISHHYTKLLELDNNKLIEKYRNNNLILNRKIIYKDKEYKAIDINNDGSLKCRNYSEEINIKCDEIFIKK